MLTKGSFETWRLWGRSREEETLGEFSLLCESGSRAPLLVIGHWLCQEHSRTRAPLALWNYYLSRQELRERIFTENNLKSPQVILQTSCSARCPQAILSLFPHLSCFIRFLWLPLDFAPWELHPSRKRHPFTWETCIWAGLSPGSPASVSKDPMQPLWTWERLSRKAPSCSGQENNPISLGCFHAMLSKEKCNKKHCNLKREKGRKLEREEGGVLQLLKTSLFSWTVAKT